MKKYESIINNFENKIRYINSNFIFSSFYRINKKLFLTLLYIKIK